MEVLHISDYEKYAEGVSNDFVEKGACLNDGILKVAKDKDMNPDQIKRLVEMANTKTFLKLFKDKDGTDRDVDFDVADAGNILKKFYSVGEPKVMKITRVTISKVPSQDFELDMPDMMRTEREPSTPKIIAIKEGEEKIASLDIQEDNAEGVRLRSVMKLRKVAEELMNRVYESEHEFVDGIDKLSADFASLYGPSYSEFEKDAVHRFGKNDPFIKFALNEIRANIRWDKDMYSPTDEILATKIASEKTEQITCLQTACACKKLQVKYAEGIKVVNKRLEELLKDEENK